MKEIDKIRPAMKLSNISALKASRYKSQLYKDDAILKRKEEELLEKYKHVARSESKKKSFFKWSDFLFALLIAFAFFNYIIFYS